MTSSSSFVVERGLDTMVLVYSLLQGHPAEVVCEQFLRAHSGWFTSPLVFVEAKNILTKVYGVHAVDATNKLIQLAAGPIVLLPVDETTIQSALQLADDQGIDLTDSVLLHHAQQCRAGFLATDDQRLAQACGRIGITPQTPLDDALRQQIANWEITHLAPKGLPRILRQVNHWLSQTHPQAASDFWRQTGNGIHLP